MSKEYIMQQKGLISLEICIFLLFATTLDKYSTNRNYTGESSCKYLHIIKNAACSVCNSQFSMIKKHDVIYDAMHF